MSTMTTTRLSAPTLAELDPEERMSRDELESLQLSRLQSTVTHAYAHVPFYRAKFDEIGVHPDDIRSLDDVKKLPLTSKEDLRQNYPFGMFAVPMVHNAYGYGLFTGGLGAHDGIEKLGATVIPMSGGRTSQQIQLIHDFQPDVILATPSYLLTIVDAMIAAGVDPRSTSLKAGVLGAEPWTNQMRAELEERLDIDALDIYGLSEVMGPGVANECIESKDGPHIWEDHFLPEIIDEQTGESLPDGTRGELVFTSLTKQAFPVIRYRTRDLTKLLPGTARPSMRRIEKITGRDDDMIILRGVNMFPTQIEEIVLGVAGLSPHFVLELSRPARLDELTVRVERREDADGTVCERASVELIRRVKSDIGSSVHVAIVEPGTLERSAGKLKRLYDLR